MAANLEDQLIDKVRALPPNKQQEALRLLDTLATGASSEGTGVDRKPVWQVVDEQKRPHRLRGEDLRDYGPAGEVVGSVRHVEVRLPHLA